MQKPVLKSLLGLALTLSLLFALCVPALAEGTQPKPDLTQTSILCVTPKNVADGGAVAGLSFTLYRVADVTQGETGLVYTLTNEFAASGADLSNLSDSGLPNRLTVYAHENNIDGTTRACDEAGTASFSNLAASLYLVAQADADTSYTAESFLVALPCWDAEKETWSNCVFASPKTEEIQYVTPTPSPDVTPSPAPTAPTATPAPKLAQTGQLNWPIPLLAICGLLFFALGWGMKHLDGSSVHDGPEDNTHGPGKH